MKDLLLTCTLVLASLTVSGSQDLPKAFKKGDVETIANQIGSSVQISYDNLQKTYSREQAMSFLAEFFEEHNPQSYEVVHHGNSRGKAKYSIGKLTTNDGVYRVYLYFEGMDTQSVIKELRLENHPL